MISGNEFERRLRRISQLREVAIRLREAAHQAFQRGEIHYEPVGDIRSDARFWEAKIVERVDGPQNLLTK